MYNKYIYKFKYGYESLCNYNYIIIGWFGSVKSMAVALGGLVVSVLATGPKICGFDPDR
jgi:hypothetical protein